MTYLEEVKSIDLQAATKRLKEEAAATEPGDCDDIPFEPEADEALQRLVGAGRRPADAE